MKVSIITATYNSEKTLRDTLDSLLAQDYPNLELIIVDGKSTDATLDIVASFGKKIAHCISEKDKGIYDAMNKGIDLATGDVVGILNSDDYYNDSQVISAVVDAFNQQNSDTVYGDLQYVDEVNTDKIVRNWKAGTFKRENFLYGWMPPHPSFFVKRELYAKFGKFDLNFKTSADYELMLRLLFKHKISTHYLPKVLVKMRTGGQSNVSLKNRLRANREDRTAWIKNDCSPRFYTTILKPLRKISQYFTI